MSLARSYRSAFRGALLLAAGAFSLLAAAAQAHHDALPAERAAQIRQALSRHELRLLDGKRLALRDLKGEVVVVNFWATWCKPCREEMPALTALHKEIAPRGARVVAVSIDQELTNVKRFVRVHGLPMTVAHDGPEGLARTMDIEYVPFTVVLDRAGRLAFASEGSDDHAIAELVRVTRKLVREAPVATSDGQSR